MAEPDYQSLIENLIDPVVIMNRYGKICFMNPRGKQMLGRGLKERLEEHVNKQPVDAPVSKVRFAVDGGGSVILKLKVSKIQWAGEPALSVSVQDVGQYVSAIEKLRGGGGEESAGSTRRRE